MGLIRSLVREARAIDKVALWGRGADLIGTETDAGVTVSHETAVRMTAVYACVRLRAETIASLPADVFRRVAGTRTPVDPQPSWIRQPNPDTTWFEFVEQINRGLDTDGNAYVLIAARDLLGFPRELWTINPREVEVRRENGRLVFVWGGSEVLSRFDALANPGGDVLHIKNVTNGGDKGLSPIAVAREAIGLGLAAQKFGARFFGAGQAASGLIELPESDPKKSREHLEMMAESFTDRHGGVGKSHLPGVLTGGAKWTQLTIPPDQAQFLETRKFQVTEIARIYGIPPHMIGEVDRSTSWGSGIEQQSIGFVQYSLAPRLVRLEHAFNQLTPRGQFIKWNVNGLLRGDMRARAEFYAKGIDRGWFLRSDARELEDMPPVDGLDRPVLPSNFVVLDGDDVPQGDE